MKSRVKREMDKQLIYIASLLIIVGKTRPDYQTMVKSRSNCFIISGCCVITGTGSNMVLHFGHYEMLCNTPYLRPNRMLCNRFHGGRHLGTTGTTRLKTNALYYSQYYEAGGMRDTATCIQVLWYDQIHLIVGASVSTSEAIGKHWLNSRIKPGMYVRRSTMYEKAPFH